MQARFRNCARAAVALALRALGRLEEARAAFEAAERLGNREAIGGKGCLDLTLGDFERGWSGYESALDRGQVARRGAGRALSQHGAALASAGERVLVMNDHGLGDTIQFAATCR